MSRGIVCLTRTLGDTVIGNVLVKNIKLSNPKIELDYIVEQTYADLVQYNPYISNVIPISSTEKDWDTVLSTICSSQYDKVFFAQQTSGWDNNWHQRIETRNSHLLDYYAERCNVNITDRKLELFVEDCLVPSLTADSSKTIAIHTQTLANVKDWSKFSDLVAYLKSLGYDIVHFVRSGEQHIDGSVRAELSIKQVMNFFKQHLCKSFVGLDSGLSYISAAFGVTTIVIQGATIPVTSGPWGNNVIHIVGNANEDCIKNRNNVRCHGILNGNCNFGSKCIDNVTVDEVVKAILLA